MKDLIELLFILIISGLCLWLIGMAIYKAVKGPKRNKYTYRRDHDSRDWQGAFQRNNKP